MSVNEEVEAAGSDSFWEVDQFRRTVKRVDDGLNMSHELARLITERSEIEREYAKKLQSWSKKWSETIEKGSHVVRLHLLCHFRFVTFVCQKYFRFITNR